MIPYEERMKMMQWVRPEKKDELLLRLTRGEVVDITRDEDLFYRINVDRMPIDKLMNRDKYKPLADDMKTLKQNLDDPKYGKTRNKKFRYLGEIPSEIYFTHPWFSPLLSREERDKNIKRFFNMFPAFRAGEKEI